MKTPLRVLLVEDSEDDAELVLLQLRRGNFTPTWERVDTEQAMLRALENQTWDLIIADYSMPNFNGQVALSLVKQRGLDIPFIIVSGTIGEEIAVETMKAGAHDYLMKDNLARLVPAIKRELSEAVVREKERQAQEALRESEQRLQLALTGANDGVWDWNIQTDAVFYSPRWAELLGFSIDEIKPHISTWNELIHPKDLPLFKSASFANFEGQTENFQIEHRMQTKSREWKWFHTQGKVVNRYEDGMPLRAAGTIRDVTEKKQLEEQFRQAQKMESIGLLAGGIAHDFNNLLTVIVGHVDLELGFAQKDPQLNKSLVESLQQIGLAAERAASLTRQLLAFSRKQVVKLEVLEPEKILVNFEPMLRRIIGENIKLKIVKTPNIGRIRADAGLIEQVIMNLAVNACDAMPDGGSLYFEISGINIEKNDQFEHLNLQQGPNVLLTVRDTGFGMDRETQAKAFEPFFTTKPLGKGTGLGLATVYGIIKQFGGHITVESEPGQGTSFNIYLPSVDSTLFSESRKKQTKFKTGSETILVCEDEEIVRKLISMILKRAGYKLQIVKNGLQALKLASNPNEKIDLLISDIVMPDMSGNKLAEALLKKFPTLPVLFISGYGVDAISESDVFNENIEFLNKPFHPDDLLQCVRKILDK